jgi:hypothetical protein
MKRLLALSLLLAVPLAAQVGRGSIQGTISDSSGAVVAGANVTILNVGTNAAFTTVTSAEGYYSAPTLAVGNYTVSVEKQGFKRAVRTGIVLQVDQRAQVDVTLDVGGVTESVQVQAEAPLVDTGGASIGKVVENRRVVELPLNGRNALALTLLTPSVKSNAGPTNSGFGDRGIQLSSISINGGPNAMNGQLLDGGNNIQSYIGEVAINPGVDAVEEFKVQSGTMSAEYGFTAGGVINMVTKSGTNQIHGTVYEFFRNDKLDARNTFSVTKPPFRYNQYGVSAGGPIVRDKTFAFGNWEDYKYRRSEPRIGTFPTALQRTGDFSDLLDTAGRLIPIYDPATTRANPNGTGFIRDVFPGNRIPANRLDPVALRIQDNFYPLPNRTPTDPFTNANNFGRLGSEMRDSRQFTFKVDHHFGSNNYLFGRYSSFRHKTDNGASGSTIYPNDAVAKRDDDLQTKNFTLADTHTFTPLLINEFRLSVTRGAFPFVARSFGADWPSQLGFPSSVPNFTVPSINNGLPGFNTGTVGFRGSLNWQFLNQVTRISGAHTFKFGYDFRILAGNNFQMSAPSGSFNFNSALTANPLSPAGTGSTYASFLLGQVANASATSHVGESQHAYNTSAFFQDDWKVTRRLTLNLGLRWDFQQQAVESNNGVTNFDLNCRLPNGLSGCTIYAGVDGQPRAFRDNDWNDFGPRFGFAFDVFGNSRTVLRGGYGIYYPSQMWRENYGSAAGFAQTSTTYPANDANSAAFLLRNGFPSPVVQPQGRALGPQPFLGQNVTIDERNGQTPMSQQFSLNIQHQLPGAILLDLGYSGNLGRNFTAGSYDLNQLDPQYLSLGLALQDQVTNPYAGLVPGAFGGARISRLQSLRPYPYYGSINVRNPRLGNYNSHLFVMSIEKRMTKGLTALFSYTAGKIISDSIATPVNFGPIEQASVVNYQNAYNRRAERSLDPTDVNRRAVVSLVYELPFGRGAGALNKLIGGWQLNTIGVMQTGIPLMIRGAANNLADRPDSTGVSAKLDNPTRDRWFDTTQFINPAIYTFGNVPRVLPDVRAPGTINWDLSAIKNTRFAERFNLQFRAEAFNFLNRVNLGIPNTSFSPGPDGRNRSGTFGTITSARDARNVQLALKLIF